MAQPIPHPHASPAPPDPAPAEGDTVVLDGERYHRIRHVDALPPFLMSVVSASDLWMFVASNGALTAGRVDADAALFPYVTVDQLIDGVEHAGPKTVLRATRAGRTVVWEPFSERGRGTWRVERDLYKNTLGNRVVFEERHLDLGLAFRYAWRGSDAYGFVRTCALAELAGAACDVEVLDGVQNVLPAGATAALQGSMSNLLDAYKRHELDARSGLALFALSSTLTDLAEPSESLRATTVFALGVEPRAVLLTTEQLDAFRHGPAPRTETDVRGRRGAFLVHAAFALAPNAERRWSVVADVRQDHARVVHLANRLTRDPAALAADVEADVRRSDAALEAILARADGFQWTADAAACDYHRASVLFNVLRGGVFGQDPRVPRDDLVDFVRTRQRRLLVEHEPFFAGLPERLTYAELVARAAERGSADLERVCRSYLPLAFGRRHGDPSRPWNRFAIRVRAADGSPRLDYQGNWRDVFQNWEALAQSFPEYAPAMISVFLSATTADGYNPYRVTRDGIEWEVPEPDHPWANIGYWSDHQVIYLQKLLEVAAAFAPGDLEALLERRVFAHANVPYRIRPYADLLVDASDTIDFDWDLQRRIERALPEVGTDARLRGGRDGAVVHATMAEKLLLLLLAKLANLVPEGGVWMNTQRPEWNDANNALVGKGLSVVTTAYLHRSVAFLRGLLRRPSFEVAEELATFFHAVDEGLRAFAPHLERGFDDRARRAFMDALGGAGAAYRARVYAGEAASGRARLDGAAVAAFLERAQAFLAQTLRANRRPDALYHAYNTLELGPGRAAIGRLDEMLEGQVAVLSAGLLSAEESLELLASLRRSRLYRADQRSYVLYPDRALPGFLEKNRVPEARVRASTLLATLLDRGDRRLVVRDENGDVRFQGDFRNAKSVRRALAELAAEPDLAALVAAEGDAVVATFEEVFDHARFTGRSGSFFAYEGLGSIYWHMVSKLRLAVLEVHDRAHAEGEPPERRAALAAAYADVRAGLGYHKTPAEYGAFPTDPYSHTPAHAGAQQPGMTGQVKEDVLARFGELGVRVAEGRLGFAPRLLSAAEFLDAPLQVAALGVRGPEDLTLEPGALAFTFCQVPVVLRLGAAAHVAVVRADGGVARFAGAELDAAASREVFARSGAVRRIDVTVPAADLELGPAAERTDPRP